MSANEKVDVQISSLKGGKVHKPEVGGELLVRP